MPVGIATYTSYVSQSACDSWLDVGADGITITIPPSAWGALVEGTVSKGQGNLLCTISQPISQLLSQSVKQSVRQARICQVSSAHLCLLWHVMSCHRTVALARTLADKVLTGESASVPALVPWVKHGVLHPTCYLCGLMRHMPLVPYCQRCACACMCAGLPRGRAPQMNAAAGVATGDALVFLHADTQISAGLVRGEDSL